MKIRTFHILTVFAAVAALTGACNARPEFLALPTKTNPPPTLQPTPTSTPPVEATPEFSAGLCSNPLAPVALGATWTYLNTEGGASPSTFSSTITDVQSDGFTVATMFDDNTTVNQQWSCKPEGLVALSPGAGQTGFGLSLPGVQANLTTSNATGLTLPANVQSGMKWPYNIDLGGTLSQGGLSADLTGTITTEFQAIGTEQVTVAAGTFDAMKVQGATTLKVSANYHGLSLPITSVINTTFWFAPGVGWIKSAESGELAGTAVNATTELQSYNIP